MNQKRVGQILKEAREEKKLTPKDVARETNMSVKYIVALETEDYSQFPGETFTIGFLKNYGGFLKLDTGMLVNLYRGEKIEESQAPLEELTRPTSSLSYFRMDKGTLITLISVVVLLVSGYLVYQATKSGISEESEVLSNIDEEKEIPETIEFVSRSISVGRPESFILTADRGVSFSVNNQQCKLFIRKVDGVGPASEKRAVLGFNIFPETNVHEFTLGNGEQTILTSSVDGLSGLRGDVNVLVQATTDTSAKVLVTITGESQVVEANETTEDTAKPLGDVPIQLTLFFTKPSYAEFMIDGQMGFRGLVPAGETKSVEAKDRLEIKVGDGSAVQMIQNGKPKVTLGRPGQLVKKIFVKTPNPYDSTQFIIKELGE